MASSLPAGIKPFSQRTNPKTLCMFDVDGTLSLARQLATPEMIATLKKLREHTAVAFVGGSDLSKIREQLEQPGSNFLNDWDYGFAENGLTAYKFGEPLESNSFIKFIGEEQYKKLVNFILRYLSEVDCPVKRGTFIEYRAGMINVSPIGRAASTEERDAFEKFDKTANIRPKMVEALKAEFGHLGLKFSIGGQISFDVFPIGWDKTYSLKHVESEGWTEIHFFGDKCFEGGNDYEIYSDSRTIGHSVKNPGETQKLLEDLFINKA